MAAIANADPSLPIAQVYEQARWADPATREEEIMKRIPPRPATRDPRTAAMIAKMQSKHVGGAPATSPVNYEGDDLAEAIKRAVARQKGG